MTYQPGDIVKRRGFSHRFVIGGEDTASPGAFRIIRDDPQTGVRESYGVNGGDLELVTPAPVYTVGQTFHFRHRRVEVVEVVSSSRLRIRFVDYFHTSKTGVTMQAGDVQGLVGIADVVAQKLGGA